MRSSIDYFDRLEHDPQDPSPWQALFYDRSIPFDQNAKAAFLYDSQSKSRQFLHPFVRLFARLAIGVLQLLKVFWPKVLTSPKLLHLSLYWGMKYWVTPEANYLILRHFNLGSEVLRFIADNVPGISLETTPLKPTRLAEVKDNLFLQHDLNLYNFVIKLNKLMQQEKVQIVPVENPDFSAISTEDFPFEPFRDGWTNFLDLSTAIEIFTPVYQFFLTNRDFWRASNSLQLDETIGLYAATILNCPEKLVALNNKHPMIPLSVLNAGFRLTLHGLSTEVLHGLLVEQKKKQSPPATMVSPEKVGKV
uniref:Uncharacterized protein n=1 Tax=Roseihalotalea indica TaxID=2867963 RepID=A0AA49GRG5_9BACT|nr:hypothetical protein K4G66_05550 [Tunicatimonas sp. TK19036]